ncbi:MAG TPA: hypothetical protein VK524_13640, partial [Polyangiaceae bacterium]|nr:hypothetical protein [Polyangiaceae bacterium]
WPNAATYHDAIENQTNFTRITRVTAVQPGDLIAIEYDPPPAGLDTSGHIAIVHSAPVLRTASLPIVPSTTQYDVMVVDSSASCHGSADTRYSRTDGGAGRGTLRLYADASGNVAGYAWSTFSNSVYYSLASGRHVVIGRYTPAAAPSA